MLSARRLALAFATALLLLPGCKKKVTDDRPQDDRDILLGEQKRINRGEIVGEPLRLPKIIVDAEKITINGHRVAGRRDLDVQGRMRRIEPVFDWMKGMREHWKTIHPGESFTEKIDLTLPEDMTYLDGVSLVSTLAFAGYPQEVTVKIGSTSTTIDVHVPGPPREDAEEKKETSPPVTFSLCKADGAWHAVASTPPPEKKPSLADIWGDPSAPTAPWGRDPTPSPTAEETTVIRGVNWELVTDGTSESLARKLCSPNGCTTFTSGVNGAATFKEALAMIGPAYKARKTNVTVGAGGGGVRFLDCSMEPPSPAPAPPVAEGGNADAGAGITKATTKKSPTLRNGAVQVNGRLPPEVVQRIVRQNFGRFRLCYENGLRNNPNLQGRVAVKFVIGRSGEVTTAQDGGSDLPDQGVVSCIVRGVGNLSFPQPEGGIVTVVYPIVFSPGE